MTRLPRRALGLAVAAAIALLHTPAAALAQRQPRANDTSTRPGLPNLAALAATLPKVSPPAFDEERALWLGALPLSCLDRLQSRPNPRGRANSGTGYFWGASYSLVPNHDQRRAFWGCSDWHSAVASTWVAVRTLESYPNSVLHDLTREKLNAHLGRSNLDGEMEFFRATAAAINPIPSASQTGLFERPYGFAWLLKLDAELRAWPDSQAKRWTSNLAPLATWMADSLGAYYLALVEPVRSATLNNTAQSMTLALDYVDVAHDERLRRAIATSARKLFAADTACATQSERVVVNAGGRGGRGAARGGRGRGQASSADSAARSMAPNDLTANAPARGGAPQGRGGAGASISPCLSEAALMGRVLETRAYVAWLDRFLPPMQSGAFAPLTEAIPMPVEAPLDSSRTQSDSARTAAANALAAERARLGGLSFSRAQMMERIAHALPSSDPRVPVWHRLAAIQADRGYALLRDDTSGISWVPAQALLYETRR